jgi:hypothetical protein
MNGHRSTRAAHGILYIILEVALDRPHESSQTRNYLGRQSAVVTASLHQQEVLRSEGRLGIPHVDVRFT